MHELAHRRPTVNRRAFLAGMLAAAGATMIPGCDRRPRDPPKPQYAWLPAVRADPVELVGPANIVTMTDVAPDVGPLFDSFYLGGFECSTHRRASDRKRLDVIAATRHDQLAELDYARLRAMGITAARDGVRWHLVDSLGGAYYDFSSLTPMVRAAQRQRVTISWDLCHYGWPDDLDVFEPRFIDRFARYARAVARMMMMETDRPLWFTPVNEMSFFAWAGGDRAFINPFERGRGQELKRQLVRASIAAMNAIVEVAPTARFLPCDPLINVVPAEPKSARSRRAAYDYHQAQYQSFDMLAGILEPQLGGDPRWLDVVGVNYYDRNQAVYETGAYVPGGDPRYRPLADMLIEVYRRYRRPIVIAETGVEDDNRAHWARYIAGEVAIAMTSGADIHGITWYPIVNHPGWDDDRHIHNGLWDYADADGGRAIHYPLASVIHRTTDPLTALRAANLKRHRRIQVA